MDEWVYGERVCKGAEFAESRCGGFICIHKNSIKISMGFFQTGLGSELVSEWVENMLGMMLMMSIK